MVSEEKVFDSDAALSVVIKSLWDRFGREPSEDEVAFFVLGTDEERQAVWNQTAGLS